jgi:IS30 family transposase
MALMRWVGRAIGLDVHRDFCVVAICEGGEVRAAGRVLAYERASRPKPAKLQTNLALRQIVQDDLRRRFSPEQIAGRLRRRFPEDPEMWVSTETIYQSLYVQSRGALRRELTRYLRTGLSDVLCEVRGDRRGRWGRESHP